MALLLPKSRELVAIVRLDRRAVDICRCRHIDLPLSGRDRTFCQNRSILAGRIRARR